MVVGDPLVEIGHREGSRFDAKFQATTAGDEQILLDNTEDEEGTKSFGFD